MPKVENPMSSTTHETGTENNICSIFNERLKENRVFRGVVFEIGVLDDHRIAGGSRDAGAQRGEQKPLL